MPRYKFLQRVLLILGSIGPYLGISTSFASEQDICSRTAIVNFQEVLVDTSSNNKGEGLSFYLEKDPKAKSYFDMYKKESRPKWLDAAIGTIGTGLIVKGLLMDKDENNNGFGAKEFFIIGGATTLIINYLVALTMDNHNEIYLQKSIEEYNKRNLPRIYFSPFKNVDNSGTSSIGVQGGLSQDF